MPQLRDTVARAAEPLRHDAEVRVFVAGEAARTSLNAWKAAEDAVANRAVYWCRTSVRRRLTGVRHVVTRRLASVFRTACRVRNGAIASRAARTIVVAAAAHARVTCGTAGSRASSAARARLTAGATHACAGAAPPRASRAVAGTARVTAAATDTSGARATCGCVSGSTAEPSAICSRAAATGNLRSTGRPTHLRCASRAGPTRSTSPVTIVTGAGAQCGHSHQEHPASHVTRCITRRFLALAPCAAVDSGDPAARSRTGLSSRMLQSLLPARVCLRPRVPTRGNHRGVSAAYSVHASLNSAATSRSSRCASRMYMTHRIGNIASVTRVGH